MSSERAGRRCSTCIARTGLRESYGFRQHEVNGIKDALAGKIGALCEEWRKIHGDD
jgi:hypothetical protein